MKSLYYSPELDQFRMFSGIMYTPYFTFSRDEVKTFRGSRTAKFYHHANAGDRWVRVCERTVLESEEKIQDALSAGGVSDQVLGEAVAKFYRLRDCLQTEGASEGFDFLFDWSAMAESVEKC